jgi:hypothetical protein
MSKVPAFALPRHDLVNTIGRTATSIPLGCEASSTSVPGVERRTRSFVGHQGSSSSSHQSDVAIAVGMQILLGPPADFVLLAEQNDLMLATQFVQQIECGNRAIGVGLHIDVVEDDGRSLTRGRESLCQGEAQQQEELLGRAV